MILYILFHWSGTPVPSHLVFSMHFCVWRCIPICICGERCTPHPSIPLPPCSLIVASWPACNRRQVRWSSIPISWRNSQFVVIHRVKGFRAVNEADVFFWNFLAFSMTQQMLAIWSLVLLPFLKPAWTSEVHGLCIAEAWLGEFWALLY